MIRALITVSQMFPEGGAVHTQLIEFATPEEYEAAWAALDRENEARHRNSVWGITYTIVRLT